MSLILSVESSTSICSVAIARDGVVIAHRESDEGRDHARLVASFAEQLFEECGATPSQLDAVAVSKGPGSYTGLRIGVSFAKGLCYGSGIPLIGVSTLEAMAIMAIDEVTNERGMIESTTIFAPMIDARRMEIYTQLFDAQGSPLSEIEAKVIDEGSFSEQRANGELIIFGDGAAKCHEVIESTTKIDVLPSAAAIAKIAERKYAASEFEDVAYFEPFYLKDAVITKSTKKYF